MTATPRSPAPSGNADNRPVSTSRRARQTSARGHPTHSDRCPAAPSGAVPAGLALALALFMAMLALWADPALAQEAAVPGPTVMDPALVDPARTHGGYGVLSMSRWSPYVAGGLMGVLAWLTFLFSDQRIGVSSAYAKTAGMIERAAGRKVEENAYYQGLMPFIDWGWLFVAGLVIGAFLSALLSGDLAWEAVPALWERAAGPSVLVRFVVAFAGGVLVGLGARWAKGCTSGHGISGTLQLSGASWLAVICMFAGGILSAHLIHPF